MADTALAESTEIEEKWLTDDTTHLPTIFVSLLTRGRPRRFNRLLERLLERVADDEAEPTWKPDSFFLRYATD